MTPSTDIQGTGQARDELSAAREREAALREILQVISRSHDNEQPVFETILESASRLCKAPLAFVSRVNEAGTHLRIPAQRGARPEMQKVFAEVVHSVNDSGIVSAHVARNKTVIHVADMSTDSQFDRSDSRRAELIDVEGVRSYLVVPMVRGSVCYGTLNLYRREVAPFSADEIALVETFAAQAVIAIENVRQFRELQGQLERERATRQILGVISRSRDDEAPVFRTILENSARLCRAPHALLLMRDETDTYLELVASNSARSGFIDNLRDNPHELSNKNSTAVMALDSRITQHVPDVREMFQGPERAPQLSVAADVEGMRTVLLVPLVIADKAVGVLSVYKLQVDPFSENEVALVETFAEQAVIAIENVRQFREVQERLAREQASREVLGVISQSRDDERPVFDIILKNAAHLSGAPLANLCILSDDRSQWELVAHYGDGLRHLTTGKSTTLMDSNLVPAQTMRTGQVIHIENLTDTDLYRQRDPGRVAMVESEGMRTIVGVPLLKGGAAIGCITLFRREVKAFTSDEIALVETFAAQAVIAIENVRQFRELQTRLEREAASGQILHVISCSRDDEVPVFRTILENAARLCGAVRARLMLTNDDQTQLRAAGSWGEDNPALPDGKVIDMIPEMGPVRSIVEKQIINIKDGRETEGYKQGVPQIVNNIDTLGARSVLSVPLISDDQAIGCIVLTDREVAAFDDGDAALVETFAAQAVIAIENVRQFREVQDKTKEVQALNASLETRVQEQVGEIERMGRLKRFLSPQVADAIVSTGDESLLASHRALIGILFCDIRGFTAFCESAEPEETIEVLQTFHETMGELIHSAGAGFDHRAGDGIMVVFNDPIPCDDPAGDALRTAIAMRDRMEGLCAKWRKLGHRLGFGVGISLGYATVGMVGFEGRYDYTASGSAVNLASRLCDHANDREILLSPRAAAALEDTATLEEAGELALKGFSAPVVVTRVTGLKGDE